MNLPVADIVRPLKIGFIIFSFLGGHLAVISVGAGFFGAAEIALGAMGFRGTGVFLEPGSGTVFLTAMPFGTEETFCG